jgi:hypothetical protein
MKQTGIMIAALAAGSGLVPAAAQAQTRGGFEAGVEVFDYGYRERVDGETVVLDDGQFAGFRLGYVETLGSGLFLRGRLSAAAGSVDYRAPDPAGDDRIENVDQAVGQLELHVGIDLPVGGGATLSPFTGIASRALIDESGGETSSGGLAGYDREISYAYLPVGIGARIPAGKGAVMLSAQYDLVLTGTSKSKLSRVDPDIADLKLDIGGGHGFEASIAYQMPVGKHALSFGPFVRHWKLDRSEAFTIVNPEDPGEEIEFFEPRSRTTELGFRLSFAF